MTRTKRYRPYPEYKDSGPEWLGEIPAHWTFLALARVTKSRCDGPFGSGLKSEHYKSSGVRVVRLQNIGFAEFNANDAAFIDPEYYKHELGDHSIAPGDILIAGLGDDRHPVGRACAAPDGIEPAMVKADCFRFRLDLDRAIPRFAAYQLSSSAPASAAALATGATRSRMNLNSTSSRRLVLPTLSEQRAIAAFLDRETARIDALIQKKERLIELLQEKRTALITHAVTKGLDPDVPMKDSGVEWLGEIPAHWEVKKLKSVSTLQTGITLGKRYESVGLTTRPYLRVANVQDGYLDLSDVAEIEMPAGEVRRYELLPEDVVVTEGGDFDKLGRGYVWEGQISGCLHQNHIFVIRVERTELDPHFLAAVMGSGYGRAYFTATSKQSTNLASTNSTKLRSFPVPLPDRSEQNRVLGVVSAEGDNLGRLLAQVKGAIDHLKEYRTALISAAVTGKVDVREEAA